MHLPPPIRFEKRLECPSCRQLTPVAETDCVHCGGGIPDKWRREELRRLDRQRRIAWIASAIGLPLLLVLLTLIFQSCGVDSGRTIPFAAGPMADGLHSTALDPRPAV